MAVQEVDPPPAPVAARPSATVIVARDGDGGLEVFMLERHLKSDFAGGAYVFPGGTVDERDRDPALAGVIDRQDGAGLPPHEFYVCAIRETFEEAGVLLARGEDGNLVRFGPSGGRRFQDARRALAAREMTPLELAAGESIRFAADLLHYYAHWITPELAPRRYDARFFVAALPDGQEPLHDDVETTASRWIRPADALDQWREGKLTIIFPTRKTLEGLAEFRSAAELAESCGGKQVVPVLPRIVLVDGEPRIVLPGYPGYHKP